MKNLNEHQKKRRKDDEFDLTLISNPRNTSFIPKGQLTIKTGTESTAPHRTDIKHQYKCAQFRQSEQFSYKRNGKEAGKAQSLGAELLYWDKSDSPTVSYRDIHADNS